MRMTALRFPSIRTSIYICCSALKTASDRLIKIFESHLYWEIISYLRIYQVQLILPTEIISHNPGANLLNRNCETLVISKYIVEERVLEILAQPILKNIEPSLFYEYFFENSESTYPKLGDLWTQYITNGLIDEVEIFCEYTTQWAVLSI